MALTYPHNYTSPLAQTIIRIDDAWYDVTAWRHSHPGGAEICDQFHNKDATDAFHSLHSKEAIAKLQRMKCRKVTAADPPRDDISVKFAAFRSELERQGYFERNWAIDWACYLGPCLALVIFGSYISYTYPFLATLLIGLGMQQAGWIGHDYVHGRGKASEVLGIALGGVINGFSSRWWSQKHNAHHTFPNRKEFDADIHNEPVLHLWFPDASSDVWYRKYQHLYYPLAYSMLYVSWRMQSLQFVLGSQSWLERGLLAVSYLWLACLPWKVSVGSLLVGGFLVGIIVTSNHQTEEILEADDKYNFIVDQFRSTRGVDCHGNWFLEYLFGGMQYQMEHHLFPTMPKQHFKKIRPLVTKFAHDNGMQHHISGVVEILKMNYDVMKKFAEAAPTKTK